MSKQCPSMTEQMTPPRGVRFLVIAATLVVIIAGINQAQSVLAAFLVAVFLAMLGTPPVLWLERKRIPTLVSVLLVVAAMVTILLGAGAIVGASINSFYAELPTYQARMKEQVSSLVAFLASQGPPPDGHGSARVRQPGRGDEPDIPIARGARPRPSRTSS